MAKKGRRQFIMFVCSKCGRKNYITEKNKLNTPDKMELNKFCKWCRSHTPHTETAKTK